ncbi:MAG: GrpB family protein [Planctomycetota bacterium]|jgi:GrpB-like predicted nucleotidyltransferase (UPF0157 family)
MTEPPIVVVPYDPEWPALFEQERAALTRIFPPSVAAIEHIGSTAVTGLGAKPVIDIMVGVDQLAAVVGRIAAVEDLGYEYVPEYESELPDRRYFRKPREQPRTHHLHAVERESEFWRRHLQFRDFLRANAEAVRDYYELKCRLSREYGQDHIAYTEAKSEFIERCLARSGTEGATS